MRNNEKKTESGVCIIPRIIYIVPMNNIKVGISVLLSFVYCLVLGPILSGYVAIENATDINLEPLAMVLMVVFYPHVIVGKRFPAYGEYLEWWVDLGDGI